MKSSILFRAIRSFMIVYSFHHGCLVTSPVSRNSRKEPVRLTKLQKTGFCVSRERIFRPKRLTKSQNFPSKVSLNSRKWSHTAYRQPVFPAFCKPYRGENPNTAYSPWNHKMRHQQDHEMSQLVNPRRAALILANAFFIRYSVIQGIQRTAVKPAIRTNS